MNEELKKISKWSDVRRVFRSYSLLDMGTMFEVLVKLFITLNDTTIKNIWYRADIPDHIKKKYVIPNKDMGIDMVCETKENEIHLIQCKYIAKWNAYINKDRIDTFTHEIKRTGLRGILISNVRNYEQGLFSDNLLLINNIFNDEYMGKRRRH